MPPNTRLWSQFDKISLTLPARLAILGAASYRRTLMKRIITLLLSGLLGSSAFAQPASPFPARAPLVQLTPAAARCDLAACQSNFYVERSHCNTRDSGACSTQAQICVQACADQCK